MIIPLMLMCDKEMMFIVMNKCAIYIFDTKGSMNGVEDTSKRGSGKCQH